MAGLTRTALTITGVAIMAALVVSVSGLAPFPIWPAPGSLAFARATRPGRAAADAEARMRRAAGVVRAAKLEAGLPIDAGAPAAEAAWIGSELTPFVTTLGSLEAKRVAASPLWARVLAAEFAGRGVGPGSVVAANFSGSFPALNVAVLCAAEALGARVVAATSVTASTWGASDPGFTWPQIEALLVRHAIIRPATVIVSIGGDGDRGLDLDPGARADAERIGRAAAASLHAAWLAPASFEEAVQARIQAFEQAAGSRPLAVFVNVGGTQAGLGQSPAILQLPGGWVTTLPEPLASSDGGLVAQMVRRGIPVLHLLNVRALALKWGVR